MQEDERRRIQKAGGVVLYGRVDGDLAVSRGFGDFTYKQRSDLPPEAQRVSCEPEVVVHKRSEKDEVLVFACDGIWDVWKDMEAMRTALNEMIVGNQCFLLKALCVNLKEKGK